MGESFEAKLIKCSTKEIFKKAKQILHNGELLCCHENALKSLRAVFRDSKGLVTRTEIRGFPAGPYSTECSSCGRLAEGLCHHGVAIALYHSRYTIKERGKKEILPDTPESVKAQIERVAYYENIMQQAENGAPELLRQLSDYYGSPAWKRDFAADEAGRFPKALRRGVLSEDGIYHLLERFRA